MNGFVPFRLVVSFGLFLLGPDILPLVFDTALSSKNVDRPAVVSRTNHDREGTRDRI